MAGVRRLTVDERLLAAVCACFVYPPGEKRATGYLYPEWPEPLVEFGPALLADFPSEVVVFQAYRDGTATCDWHSDAMPQAILSLGATRTFGLGDDVLKLAHGDVVRVEPGARHCVFPDPIPDERIALVFRGAQ